MKRKTGGGAFDPNEELVYFVAAAMDGTEVGDLYPWTLYATNDLGGDRDPQLKAEFERRMATGSKVLLDSGIFWLTNRHKRAHDVTMNEALGLAPEKIDGFDELFEQYVTLVKQYESTLWGYIELDQGGAENKRRTRQRLHDLGLNPIPVYHPINDGWDYLDELFEGYDRICVGNVVQASMSDRKRILATVWERHRLHPDVWIHVLGLTPDVLVTVYPASSYDSSGMMSAVRYGADHIAARAMGQSFGRFSSNFSYALGDGWEGDAGYGKGRRFVATEAFGMLSAMRALARDRDEVFGVRSGMPAPFAGEPAAVPGVPA